MAMTKQYLGDGVYVDVSERGLVLTTENGHSVTNTIYLEPEIVDHLLSYRKLMQEKGQL